MKYVVDITKDGDGYMASFPDIPEALTSAPTREAALGMAQDALVTALDFYFEDRREVPAPRPVTEDRDAIELPVSLSAKVLLLNEMVRQKVRPADLARKLHTSAQEVNRLTDLRHRTRVDSIQQALATLGKRLEVSVV